MKKLLIFIIFIVNVFGFGNFLIVDKNYQNNKRGNGSGFGQISACITIPGASYYTSIQDAINNANSYDYILICPDIYEENINVDKPLTFYGLGNTPEDVLIDGGDNTAVTLSTGNTFLINLSIKSNDRGLVCDWANDVLVAFNLQYVDINATNGGIYFNVAGDVSFDNLNVYSDSGYGVKLGWGVSGDVNISNTKINSNDTSLEIDSFDKNLNLSDSSFTSQNGYGIYTAWGAAGAYYIEDVNVTNYSSYNEGILFDNGNTVTYPLLNNINIMSYNTAFHIKNLKDGEDINFSNITIENAGKYGIWTEYNADGNHIFDNINIKKSYDTGIYVERGGQIFKSINIDSNGRGIWLKDSGVDLNFTDVNITSLYEGIYTEYNVNQNKYFSNIKINTENSSNINSTGIYIDGDGLVDIEDSEINASGDGVYINNAKAGHIFKNLIINSNLNGINLQTGGKVFYNLEINASGGRGINLVDSSYELNFTDVNISSFYEGIYTDANANGNKTFYSLNITSQGNGVYIKGDGLVDMEDSNITTSADGIYIENSYNPHIFKNLIINSNLNGINLQTGGSLFYNLNIKANGGRGIEVEDSSSDLNFTDVNIYSLYEGIYTGPNANANKTFYSLNISSQGNGIYIDGSGLVNMDDISIESSGYGIYFSSNAGNGHILNKLNINSNDVGIYCDGISFSDLNNSFIDSNSSGVWLTLKSNNSIENSVILAKDYGIKYLDGSDNNYNINISYTEVNNSNIGIELNDANSINLNNLCIGNIGDTGVNVVGWNTNSFTMMYSKIRSNNYDLYIDVNPSSDVEVIRNCFFNKIFANSSFTFKANFYYHIFDTNDDKCISDIDSDKLTNVMDCSFSYCCPASCGEGEICNIEYIFDAWDIDRNVSDRNISTKIINKEFNLTIASINKFDNQLVDFNGTVCVRVISNNYIGDWKKLFFDYDKEKNQNFIIDRAIKAAKVNILWLLDKNTTCPLSSISGESNSSDEFAVRPYKFKIIGLPNVIKAGEEFNLTLRALDYTNNLSKDYNESLYYGNKDENTSPLFNVKIFKPWCSNKEVYITKESNFTNGEANISVKISNVGEYNVSISEVNGSEFAIVDSDDTNDSERFIAENEGNITVLVHHFKVVGKAYNYDNDNNFTYLDNNISQISSVLDINITAENKDNETTTNYNYLCYSKDVNISVNKDLLQSDINVSLLRYYFIDASNLISKTVEINKDENISLTYKEGNFTTENNGSTRITFYLNFDRNISNPTNPFEMNITEVNVTDGDGNGSSYNLGNVRFYYGNLQTYDIVTTNNNINATLNLLVYSNRDTDNLLPLNAREIAYNEWENLYHQIKDGNVSNEEIVVSKDYNASNSISGIDVSVNSIGNGNIKLQIIRNDDNINFVVIHLLSPNLSHLWYSKFNEKYDISNTSTCLNHFCFSITWQNDNTSSSTNNAQEVGNGDFNATAPVTGNTNINRKGLKIFR